MENDELVPEGNESRGSAPAGSSREYNTRSQGNSATVLHERRRGPAAVCEAAAMTAKVRLGLLVAPWCRPAVFAAIYEPPGCRRLGIR
jgi:hypothetical protein